MSFKTQGGVTAVSNAFIDTYFNKAPYIYCLVYIYACRILSGGGKITNEEVASALRLPISDVINAWKYFSAEGVLDFCENPFSISFRDEFFKIPSITEKKKVITQKRPEYSPKEIDIFSKTNDNIKNLFATAQSHLGKMLTQSDMSTILGFYDWLRLPLDVIEILFAYCTKNNHYSLKYIEAVALDWAEKDITTPKKAIDYIRLHNKEYRTILKAFGITNRLPTPAEEKFIQKWLFEYKMNIDIITIACERTLISTGKAGFPYADKIITGWYNQNVKSKADIDRLDKQYSQSKKEKSSYSQSSSANTIKKNRFVNYEQRIWDFEKLRSLEREHIKKQLEENNERK